MHEPSVPVLFNRTNASCALRLPPAAAHVERKTFAFSSAPHTFLSQFSEPLTGDCPLKTLKRVTFLFTVILTDQPAGMRATASSRVMRPSINSTSRSHRVAAAEPAPALLARFFGLLPLGRTRVDELQLVAHGLQAGFKRWVALARIVGLGDFHLHHRHQ